MTCNFFTSIYINRGFIRTRSSSIFGIFVKNIIIRFIKVKGTVVVPLPLRALTFGAPVSIGPPPKLVSSITTLGVEAAPAIPDGVSATNL
jgi:hypothetical protein